VIATVQLAQLGAMATVRSLVRAPVLTGAPGLRWAETMVMAPLAASRPPALGRAGLIAFWDDEGAADRFVEEHPVGRRFAGGLRAHLRPLRAHGSWPGLPDDVPAARAVPHEGPVVVLTLARLRPSQAFRFARSGRPAEKAAVASEGMVWGTAGARLPFLATMSIWRDSRAAAAYAYGRWGSAHVQAMDAQHAKDFHRRSAFIRFAPTRLEGTLEGTNPFDASVVAV
jgi:hypothetical protein